MSEYSSLKATINANIKANNNHEITGAITNSVLNAMVNSLGAGYQFIGVATPTNPGSAQTPDYKCFYLATTPGTYTYLGGLVVSDGEVALLKWDTAWTKEVTVIASADQLNQLGQNLFRDIEIDNLSFSVNKAIEHATGEYGTSGVGLTSTPPIEILSPNLVIEYQLRTGVDNDVVSFFDKDKNYLQDISFVGNGTKSGTINLMDGNYKNVRYVIFGNYQPDFANPVVIIKNIPISKQIYDAIADSVPYEKVMSFPLSGGVKHIDGTWENNPSLESTELYEIFFRDLSISYKLRTGVDNDVVSFFDKDMNYLQNISFVGNGTKSGTIILSNSEYDNAKYVRFCNYYPDLPNPHVKIFNNKVTDSVIDRFDNIVCENTKEDFSFSVDTMILHSTGEYNPETGVGRTSSPMYELLTRNVIIEYRLNSGIYDDIVSFFDKDKNYLQDISFYGNGIKSGTINLMDDNYKDVRYVIFGNYQPDFANPVVRLHNISIEGLYNEISNGMTPLLKGLKFVALGDSLTEGYGAARKSWFYYLCKQYGSENISHNFGVSGQCLRTMADKCTAENMNGTNVCFIMGGTNQEGLFSIGSITDAPTPDVRQPNKAYSVGDYAIGGTYENHGQNDDLTWNKVYLYKYECVTAGTTGNTDTDTMSTIIDDVFSDGTVEWKCLGTISLYSDLKMLAKKVYSYNPAIRLIWMIPIRQKSDIGKTFDNWENYAKFQAIRNFCDMNCIQYIDLQKLFPLNEWTKDGIMYDDIHPNQYGYQRMKDIICGLIG
jgi:lysophospholipase L1-like esterase